MISQNTLNVLRKVFLKIEIDFLQQDPDFNLVLGFAKTSSEIDALVAAGETILAKTGRMNKSARQLRLELNGEAGGSPWTRHHLN